MDVNYNDGRWHGWNGGDCPVDNRSVVEVCTIDDKGVVTHGKGKQQASAYYWDHHTTMFRIVAFRVVKEHREPRELWHVLDLEGGVFDTFTSREEAERSARGYKIVHYREVMDGEA